MGILDSIFRYVVTLGGLIGGDIDNKTEAMLATPGGIKATYDKTRENWTKQYTEVRQAVAQLMMVLEQKKKQVETLQNEATTVKQKMDGAVQRFKETKDAKYKEAFDGLFARDKEIVAEQQALNTEVASLHQKVESYKGKLTEMQTRIAELQKQEAAAIADIVSSNQIINLNDRLNNISMDLDDRNLRAIEERRDSLVAQAKLSGELAPGVESPSMDDELLAAGANTEADDLFAAMIAEGEAGTGSLDAVSKEREI